MEEELSPGTEKTLRHIPAKIFMEAFEAIVFAVNDISEEDKEKLCLLLFIDANHPILCKFCFVVIVSDYYFMEIKSQFPALISQFWALFKTGISSLAPVPASY